MSHCEGHECVHTSLRQRPGRPAGFKITMAYGVATNNIFDLLDEENEDPQALASKATDNAEKPKAKKEAAPKAKEVPKTAGLPCMSTRRLR